MVPLMHSPRFDRSLAPMYSYAPCWERTI